MEYCREIPVLSRPSAVALGLFDGLHLGHRAVLGAAAACAPRLLPTVFTFSFSSPEEATKPDFANILTATRKEAILEKLGISLECEPPFSAFRGLSPEEFFEHILRDRLKAAAVFCGEDFRFGKGAAGDCTLLRRLCALCTGYQNHLTALLFTFFENLISPGGLFKRHIVGNNFFWFQ